MSPAFVSSELASRRTSRTALAATLVSAVVFVAAVPFATLQLDFVPAFIPAYESALIVFDVVTAILLFGLYHTLRSQAVLSLACGYLFTALIAFAHLLTFPGVFSPAGLLGGGSQSTAWLYMVWHAGFPIFVAAYTMWKADSPAGTGTSGALRGRADTMIAACVAATAACALGLVLLVTVGRDLLPVLIVKGRFTAAMTAVVSSVWLMSLIALASLWRRRPHTVLDQWLMVVMCVWLFDIGLSAVFNVGRFDLGWYAGRIFGLLASSFLLGVLLIENAAHYSRLVGMSMELAAVNQALERLSRHDALTDLANRRHFDTYLEAQLGVARRQRRPLALVLIDVDHFKAFNDRFGHQAGDDCLKRIALVLRTCCRRPADLAARYGGEEFAMILPDTDLAGAAAIAEVARGAVGALRFASPLAAAACLTISCGVATDVSDGDSSAHDLVAASDKALFRAKSEGRNRIVTHPIRLMIGMSDAGHTGEANVCQRTEPVAASP